MDIKKAQFVTSLYGFENTGIEPRREIALVGRSNVGKSSLINSICTRNGLAKVSGTPGKTRAVNYFLINEEFYLVDLPGYGYANVSKTERESWGSLVEGYLQSSENLEHLFLLLDIRRDPNDDDKQMAYWLEHYQIPCTIIATKVDKVKKSQRNRLAGQLSDKLGMTFKTRTIAFSAHDKTGKSEVISRIGEVLRSEVLTYQADS